jgi:threonine dehydratase
MKLPGKDEIEKAASVVYETMQPTPQYTWPLMNQRLGAELWIKHENYTPIGAFKIRGALAYFRHLRNSGAGVRGVITATRGNHGQAVAFAARREGIPAMVYIPHGNSASKNLAMRALGATLVEHGSNFDEAREEAGRRAVADGLHFVPSFHELLVAGVASYSYELLRAMDSVDVVYVPIGMGSGICGMCAAREALGLRTEIVGVVSEHAPVYLKSFERRKAVDWPARTKLADGMACGVAKPEAVEIICEHVAGIVTVSDEEVAAAMRALFDDTHTVAEGAGAAGVAAILKAKRLSGKRVATILSGGNVDRDVLASVLRGDAFNVS